MTHLCASIFVESIDQAKRDIAAAAEAGADLVELRIDTFDDTDAVAALIHEAAVPGVIVTRRPAWEGGSSEEVDGKRIRALFDAAGEFASYVDVELRASALVPALSVTQPHVNSPRIIVSSHDFSGRPRRLMNIVADLYASGGDVAKIAWLARSIRDNIEAFDILLHKQKPLIAVCMGEAGLLSRVLARKFGAFLTYASLRPTEATAPGQPTIDQIKRTYRWDSIQPDTRVYGVVGSPIAHSLSPAVHNAAFDETAENAVYLPMLVNPGYESFKAFMEEFTAFKPLDLRGLSITIPHKENALRYLRERGAAIDPLCERIGAVNTIAIREGSLEGFNTDHDAIVQTIGGGLNVEPGALGDLRVAVIGAGGTARTAVAALAALGATVVVYNRTREKADALAAEFDGRTGKVVAARLEKLCDSCCHVFINTTPLGMHPDVDSSAFGDRIPSLSADTLVFDTVYNPAQTTFLRQAEEAGAKTVGGMEMFIRQAARQFEIWTGKPAPMGTMRMAAENALSGLRD